MVEVGVYGIFYAKTNECLYIGHSARISDRWEEHLKNLRNGNHPRKNFVEWFRERDQDESILSFEILEETDNTDEALNRAEIKWFNKCKPRFYGKIPSMNETWRHSEKTKQKISKSVRKANGTFGKNRKRVCRTCKEIYFSSKHTSKYCSRKCINVDQEIRKRGFIPRNDLDASLISSLYEEGKSLRAIAREVGVSPTTVKKVLEKEGTPLRERIKALKLAF